jgi:hypothetical protein
MHRTLQYDQSLTNEHLNKQFASQFDLVGRAINIANYLVRSGKAVESWPDNVAFEVLKRMSDEGVDMLERELRTEGGKGAE